MTAFTTNFDRKTAGFSPGRVDALVWALTDLMIAAKKSYGIFELYRQMAEEERGERQRSSKPDPRLRREQAILDERRRFAALIADRPPTSAEAAAHLVAIDEIKSWRP